MWRSQVGAVEAGLVEAGVVCADREAPCARRGRAQRRRAGEAAVEFRRAAEDVGSEIRPGVEDRLLDIVHVVAIVRYLLGFVKVAF